MNVTTLIFLGLAVVWAIVLLPEAVRKLSTTRQGDSIRSFNHQLSVLDRSGSARPSAARSADVIDLATRGRAAAARTSTGAAPSAVRMTPSSVRRRRQEVLTVLGAAAVLTLLGTVAFGGAFLVLHLLADVLLVAYLVALYQVNQQTVTRRAPERPAHVTVRPSVASAAPRRIAN